MAELEMSNWCGDPVAWNAELKPCPFCGGKASISRDGESGIFSVSCIKCCASIESLFFQKAEDAIAAWNRRRQMDDYIKLIADLRWTGNDYPLSEMIFDISIFDKAADAIEALQAERHNLQVHADYCESERDAYKDETEWLRKRLDAAVADISMTAYRERKMPCAVCTHADEPLVNGISPCSGCCESNSKFLWRGEV